MVTFINKHHKACTFTSVLTMAADILVSVLLNIFAARALDNPVTLCLTALAAGALGAAAILLWIFATTRPDVPSTSGVWTSWG